MRWDCGSLRRHPLVSFPRQDSIGYHMKRTDLAYPLTDGFVDDWLVLGPHDQPLDARPGPTESQLAFRSRMLNGLDHKRPDFHSPMEVDRETFGEQNLYWEIKHCEADHLLDWSGSCSSTSHRRAWAFALLSAPMAGKAKVRLTTTCPTALWLDDKLIGHCEHVAELADQMSRTYTFDVDLKARDNRLLVRLDQIALGEVALAFALRVAGRADRAPLPAKRRLAALHLRLFPALCVQRARHQGRMGMRTGGRCLRRAACISTLRVYTTWARRPS